MNKFYQQNIIIQWVLAFIMFAMMMALMIVWVLLMKLSFWAVFSLFIVVLISQFLVSPLYTLMGLYKYLSPMLLVVNASDKKYDIHNGTSFDYFFLMRKTKIGAQWKKAMLIYYLDGLLEIIRRVNHNEISEEIEIRGSSYFFSERTAKNMGFKIQKTGSFEKFNLLLNYLDLLWTFSASKGKINFPNLYNIKTVSITGKLLSQNKQKLLKYKNAIS